VLHAPDRHVSTLVIALRGDAVAMIHRAKEPNAGLWSPPGGMVELHETALANALRELREETGLVARAARLRAVVHELDPVRREVWLMFVFLVDCDADSPAGAAGRIAGGPEGEAAWVRRSDLAGMATPPADAHILAAALASRPGVAFLDVRFRDGGLESVDVSWA